MIALSLVEQNDSVERKHCAIATLILLYQAKIFSLIPLEPIAMMMVHLHYNTSQITCCVQANEYLLVVRSDITLTQECHTITNFK